MARKKSDKTEYIVYFLGFLLIIALVVYCVHVRVQENFARNEPKVLEIKERLKILDPSIENLEFFAADKSYTINKHKVHLCLKDENGDYYQDNMLMYVALHELAHVFCDEIGHTNKFNMIFKDLLAKAEKLRLYDSNIPPLANYCNYS